MTPDAVPIRNPRLQLADMEGEILLYCLDRKTMLQLNESAAAVWRLCDGQRSVGEIVALLSEAFPAASHEIEADIHEIVDRFVGEEVLTLD